MPELSTLLAIVCVVSLTVGAIILWPRPVESQSTPEPTRGEQIANQFVYHREQAEACYEALCEYYHVHPNARGDSIRDLIDDFVSNFSGIKSFRELDAAIEREMHHAD